MRGCWNILFCFACLVCNAQANNVLTIADSMPQFPGGNAGLAMYIQKNMVVPLILKQAGKAQKAYVQFIVDTNGSALNPVILKHADDKEFDREAIRLVSNMPKWSPGIDKNKKVNVYMTIPFSYKNLGLVLPPPPTKEHETAMEYFNEGHKLEQQEKYQKALEKYDMALKVEPENKYAMFDQAKMQMALGRNKLACETWDKMIKLNLRKEEAEDFIKMFCESEDGQSKMIKHLNKGKADKQKL